MNKADVAGTFESRGERLVGLLSPASPDATPTDLGVVIVVGGPQYRVGSHRQFVQLARTLARHGYATLRFDVRGMGDSTGHLTTFEDLNDDIAAARQALVQWAPSVQRVVLCGLCDGASASLMALESGSLDDVAGVCLLNPWARSEATQASTTVRHYYLRRLQSKAFWKQLLTGGVALGRMRELVQAVWRSAGSRPAPRGHYLDRMLSGLQRYQGPVHLTLSGEDLTAREFELFSQRHAAWRNRLQGRNVEHLTLAGADHTLSEPVARLAWEQAVLLWLGKLRSGQASA